MNENRDEHFKNEDIPKPQESASFRDLETHEQDELRRLIQSVRQNEE